MLYSGRGVEGPRGVAEGPWCGREARGVAEGPVVWQRAPWWCRGPRGVAEGPVVQRGLWCIRGARGVLAAQSFSTLIFVKFQ